MDAKFLYWSGALVNLGAVVVCGLLGLQRARRRDWLAHRRLMLTACWLVAAFLASYVVKLLVLGREDLSVWDPRYVRVLHLHETFVLAMLVCGLGALLQAGRLGLPRGPDAVPMEPARLARGLRLHRGLGRVGIASSVLGLATAAYVLWGMYERLGAD